jgi:two-component system cell cycle response regulator CpdR
MVNPSTPYVSRLLVTEDDIVLRRFYQQALIPIAKELVVTETSSQAIALLEHQEFDFLITDLKMAEKDGIDIINQAVVSCPGIKILVASGYVSDAKYREKLAGFKNITGFLQKPFTVDTLLQKLESIFYPCDNHQSSQS